MPLKKRDRIMVTKRTNPVAVIVPYDEPQRSMRLGGYKKIMEARKAFSKAGIPVGEVF
jgi:antitoxin (DNA-binding transcriptional repressor) of toxin-antitoxin stability system